MKQKLETLLNKTSDPVQIMDVMPYFEQLAFFEKELAKDNGKWINFCHYTIVIKRNIEYKCTLDDVTVAIDAVNYTTIKLMTFQQYLRDKKQTTKQIDKQAVQIKSFPL